MGMSVEARTGGTPDRKTPGLGVLGGSFNPVHLGHLHIARQTRDILGLSQVLFVVASTPPHKPAEDLVPFAHRYAMVSLATSGIAGFIPSLVELEPPASPYSVATMAKLAQRFQTSGEDLYFLAGGDSLLDVAGWYDSEALLMSYNFVFIMRPGVKTPKIEDLLPVSATARVIDCRGLGPSLRQVRIAEAQAARECLIYFIDAGAPEIAASHIRKQVSLRQDISNLVPASVNEYIQKLHLYGE